MLQLGTPIKRPIASTQIQIRQIWVSLNQPDECLCDGFYRHPFRHTLRATGNCDLQSCKVTQHGQSIQKRNQTSIPVADVVVVQAGYFKLYCDVEVVSQNVEIIKMPFLEKASINLVLESMCQCRERKKGNVQKGVRKENVRKFIRMVIARKENVRNGIRSALMGNEPGSILGSVSFSKKKSRLKSRSRFSELRGE